MEVSLKSVHMAHKRFIEQSVGCECTNTLMVETEGGKVFVSKIDVVTRHAEWMMEYIVTLASGDSIVICAETPEKAIVRANWKIGAN